MNITPSQTPPVYESTRFNLTCIVEPLPEFVDTPINISIIWLNNFGSPITNDARRYIVPIDSYKSVLVFNPIDNLRWNDNGRYQCQVFANSLRADIVFSNNTVFSDIIRVEGKIFFDLKSVNVFVYM